MLPGVGVFGTGRTVRILVPLLREQGFPIHALWGRNEEEAESFARELGIPFCTSQSDDVLLHPDVHLVCIYTPPPHTRQIAVKALGKYYQYMLRRFFCLCSEVMVGLGVRGKSIYIVPFCLHFVYAGFYNFSR